MFLVFKTSWRFFVQTDIPYFLLCHFRWLDWFFQYLVTYIGNFFIDLSNNITDNDTMLDKLFGNETLAMIFLNLLHYGEIYSGLIEKNTGKGSRAVLNQLNKMEEAGFLVSREVGRTRLYEFNHKSAFIKPLKEIINITYSNMTIKMKEEMFKERMRPRAKGKEVIK
jgi:DNA-binding transcriptional ArsR family regulator